MGATTNDKLERQIIEAAKQLFIEKGFVETNMSDIAARVGINRPTLHYYFRTKDRMFQAVFASIVAALLPKVREIIQLDLPAMERISMVLDEYIACFTKYPNMPKFVCEEIYRDVDHLLATIQSMQLDETFMLIRNTLLAEMEADRIKTVPLHVVFLTFYGLLTFPFMSRNLVVGVFFPKGDDFDPFLQEWKQYILFHIRNLLSKEET